MWYVATTSFVDPTDNQPIEKGLTYVSRDADILRLYPTRFERVSDSRPFDGSPLRMAHGDGEITRPSGIPAAVRPARDPVPAETRARQPTCSTRCSAVLKPSPAAKLRVAR